MNDSLVSAVADFLAHKRALGRKYHTEEATLRLLLSFADHHQAKDLHQLTPWLLDAFVASRRRPRARSYNHLVGVLGGSPGSPWKTSACCCAGIAPTTP